MANRYRAVVEFSARPGFNEDVSIMVKHSNGDYEVVYTVVRSIEEIKRLPTAIGSVIRGSNNCVWFRTQAGWISEFGLTQKATADFSPGWSILFDAGA